MLSTTHTKLLQLSSHTVPTHCANGESFYQFKIYDGGLEDGSVGKGAWHQTWRKWGWALEPSLAMSACTSLAGVHFLLSFFFFFKIYLFIMYSVLPAYQKRAPRWHYKWLWATMWLLEIELRTSRDTVSAFNLWAISPALLFFFKSVYYVYEYLLACMCVPFVCGDLEGQKRALQIVMSWHVGV